jgi:hypothetical protein
VAVKSLRRFIGAGGFRQSDEINLHADQLVSFEAHDMQAPRTIESERVFDECLRGCHLDSIHNDRHRLSKHRDVGEMLAIGAEGESRNVAITRASLAIDHDATGIAVLRDVGKPRTTAFIRSCASAMKPRSRPRTLAVTTTPRLTFSRLIWFGPGAMLKSAISV